LLAVVVLRVSYGKINRQRERDSDGITRLSDEELSDLGDRAPTFRYML
jgi:hypothetical protein